MLIGQPILLAAASDALEHKGLAARPRNAVRGAEARPRPAWTRYCLAIISVGLMALLRWSLDPWLGDRSPFLLFLPAVMFTAWFGGVGPGALSIALGAMAGHLLFEIPKYVINLDTFADSVGLIAFIGAGGFISWLVGAERVAREAAQSHAREAERRAKELRASEEKLRASEERHRLLLEGAMVVGIILLDADGKITDWSDGAARLFGFSRDEIIGDAPDRLYPSEANAAASAELERARAQGSTSVDQWMLKKDGSRFWAAGATTALLDTNGQLRGFAKVVRDISQKREADEKIAGLNDRLRRMATESHHRIKNNLQVLAAMADMEMMNDEAYVPVESVQRIKNYILTFAGLHDLLTANSRGQALANSVPICPMLERLVPLLKTQRNWDLQYEADPLILPLKAASAVSLLTSELVTNAFKHGADRVKVSLKSSNDTATLTVDDNGGGLPAGFDPRTSANTGLQLVESYTRFDLGGKVEYRNRPEGGARVRITFPVASLPVGPTGTGDALNEREHVISR